MVGVAQLVERWIVAPEVVGSSPIVHPKPYAESDRCFALPALLPIRALGPIK